MKPSFEKLVPDADQSFRCFDRATLTAPLKWHRHPEVELTYVESGSGSRLVGDHIGEYSDHDLVLVGSNLPHTWSSDAFRDKKYDLHAATVVQFRPDFLGTEFFEVAEMKQVRQMLDDASSGLWFPATEAHIIGKRMNAMISLTGGERLLSLLSCLHDLSQSAASKPLASSGYTGPATQEAESRIRIVCDHIQQNFSDPEFSASELADLLYMNASAFSRFFKQATGRTPSSYINELRIGYACRQLIETDRGILQIGFDSGFSSTSYFNRTFRALRDLTPREYRAEYAKFGEPA
ncbi:AraC family transcriptional regulator [Aporhodopirellula aestuarii]|uniref:AraC family transcriptional regulator n=1 Tax=Aporhodopirellula aestuarii TaxID=2950107 RepID=A0ABT0UCW3_9BACT|nr:AraC family transcriptional regulator [Aporhodopirellula aestuarii]MCM2374305.1 AraC family transcriptional regulator [Aporhodopirellula aestuarii]